MELPSTTFEEWEALHRDELIDEYRAYLRHALDDDDFAVRAVWDYEAWARGSTISCTTTPRQRARAGNDTLAKALLFSTIKLWKSQPT